MIGGESLQAIINSGKYKVNEILKAHDDYCAMLCSDVTVNSSKVYLANQYCGEYIRTLLPLFYNLGKNRISAFLGLCAQDGSFSAIFVYREGVDFNDFFSSRICEYDEGLKFADSLLRSALEFDLTDDIIASYGLRVENAVVDVVGGQVYFNMVLEPTACERGNFRTVRLGKMLDAIFKRDRYFPELIDEYIEKLISGAFESCSAAYSAWRSIQTDAEKKRKEYLKEDLLKYIGRRIKYKKSKKRKH